MFATKNTVIVPEIHGEQSSTPINFGGIPNLELESGTTGAPGHIIQQDGGKFDLQFGRASLPSGGSSPTTGQVIQVRHFIFNYPTITNSQSFTQITDGVNTFEYDITPQFADSKILLLSNISIGNTGQYGAHVNLYTKLDGGSYSEVTELRQPGFVTEVGVNSAQGTLPIGSSGYERFNFALQYLDDSVSSTDRRWYTFYYRTGTGGSVVVNATPSAYSSAQGGGGSTNKDFGKSSSQMTLMEIKG